MADEPTGLHMTAHDGAHDEPTATKTRHAMRYPGQTAWHQPHLLGEAVVVPACWGPGRGEPVYALLADTRSEDRCRTCWPTTKEN